jgi:hypothetical protein
MALKKPLTAEGRRPNLLFDALAGQNSGKAER